VFEVNAAIASGDLPASAIFAAPALTTRNQSRLSAANSTVRLQILQQSPVAYQLEVSTQSSTYLFLPVTFDVAWVASINGTVLPIHFVANVFGNGWQVPAGNYTLRVEYTRQSTYEVGIGISLATFVFSLAAAVLLMQSFRRHLMNAIGKLGRQGRPPIASGLGLQRRRSHEG
jgi:hypothetical protein